MNEKKEAIEETTETGVIYKITNKNDQKAYIGKAVSYIKYKRNYKFRYIRHGALQRFERHWRDAHVNQCCPIFHKTLCNSQKDDWKVEILYICYKKYLKKYETNAIRQHKTYLPDFGYNYFVGDNKPEGIHAAHYIAIKEKANRNRAKNGALKIGGENATLPPNIYHRTSILPNGNKVTGLFAQIKTSDGLKYKAFMSKKTNFDNKLESANNFLAEVKKKYNIE